MILLDRCTGAARERCEASREPYGWRGWRGGYVGRSRFQGTHTNYRRGADLSSLAALNTFTLWRCAVSAGSGTRSGAALTLWVVLSVVSTLRTACSGVKFCTLARCNASRVAANLHEISKVSSSTTNAASEPQQSLRVLNSWNAAGIAHAQQQANGARSTATAAANYRRAVLNSC